MTKQVKTIIENSTSAVLATTGQHGLNVVPLSVWSVKGDEIYLYNFFMRKTAENIQTQTKAVFTCWKDFDGVQIKADTVYETTGEDFDLATKEMKERFPERVLKGLIKVQPIEIYDVKPGAIGKKIEG